MAVRKRSWTTSGGESRAVWQADIVDAAGERVRKSFATKAEAKVWEQKAAVRAREGAYLGLSEKVVLRDMARDYLCSCDSRVFSGEIEVRTVEPYHATARLYVLASRFGLADLPLARIRQHHIEDFAAAMLAEGRSHATTKKAVGLISRILKRAVNRDIIASNPAAGVVIRAPRGHTKRVEIPTGDQVQALLKAADDRARFSITFALSTAVRASEQWGLRWGNVDLTRREIKIVERLDLKGNDGPPKSAAGRRTIPIGLSMVSALREWQLASKWSQPEDRVFTDAKGGPVNHHNFTTRVWKPVCKAAGVSMRWHDLRHAAISAWITSGLNPKEIMALAGHSSIQLTFDTYGHLMADPNRADALERATQNFLGT